MRPATRLLAPLLLAALAGCQGNSIGQPGVACCLAEPVALRVVNGFTTPVDVLLDGAVKVPALGAGVVASLAAAEGTHALSMRPVGGSALAPRTVTTSNATVRTFAAVRTSSGALASVALDDTGSVVPAGATKLRVLHLAPNAGTLQVYRTQPDYQQPVSWQFPFTYQAEPTSLTAPFYQSTVGTWEVRIWQSPADATGWAAAPVRLVIPLASGEKRTVVILDNPAGGVRAELF